MSERDDGDRSAKWRCAWCGKPQDRNDPPCDNCGHHKFERAVVPVAPEPADDYEPEPVWVCPECGRQHQKNSPPCSRCGNPRLERHVPSEADYADELGGTSYLDLLEPRYVAGFAVAILAGVVLVLALLGVITLPGMGDDLAVADVPGAADEANGVDLGDVEAAYLDAVNERRADAGRERLARNDRLDEVARFANQRWVKSVYGEASRPSGERLAEAIGDTCGGERVRLVTLDPRPGAAAFDSPEALAGVLVSEASAGDGTPVGTEGTLTGLDVHVGPDDRVFLSQVVC